MTPAAFKDLESRLNKLVRLDSLHIRMNKADPDRLNDLLKVKVHMALVLHLREMRK